MPNWCFGSVSVKGKTEDVKNFCKYFLFEDEDLEHGNNHHFKEYFARSFIHNKWSDFEKEHFKTEENTISINFNVDFAWSGYSCLIEGYPDGEECITLEKVCKLHNVEVEIETEESGIGFSEIIKADKKGVIHEEYEFVDWICKECGEIRGFPYNTTPTESDDLECWNCEKEVEWERVE